MQILTDQSTQPAAMPLNPTHFCHGGRVLLRWCRADEFRVVKRVPVGHGAGCIPKMIAKWLSVGVQELPTISPAHTPPVLLAHWTYIRSQCRGPE